MRPILLLPAILAVASLAGCAYDYPPPPTYHETTYLYTAPAYDYPPSPPPGTTVVVYGDNEPWNYYGWHNYARDKGW